MQYLVVEPFSGTLRVRIQSVVVFDVSYTYEGNKKYFGKKLWPIGPHRSRLTSALHLG